MKWQIVDFRLRIPPATKLKSAFQAEICILQSAIPP